MISALHYYPLRLPRLELGLEGMDLFLELLDLLLEVLDLLLGFGCAWILLGGGLVSLVN